MTTVGERKLEQGYKTTPETCGNCANMTCSTYHYEDEKDGNGWKLRVKVSGTGNGTSYFQDKFQCSIGQFSVKRMATCKFWVLKPYNID